jgi:hypothetical protein
VQSVLGYPLGSRITVFRDQEAVMASIAKESPRVKMWNYGRSVQGRTLRLMAISSPENIARLEQIRQANFAVAENGAAPTGPVIVWINQTIHGNEPASFESAMMLAYTLAAGNSAEVRDILKNAVVLINPVYNPDGHERFAVFYNSIARDSRDPNAFEFQEPSLISGRSNHFRFDMNRDRVAFSQDETVFEVQEYLRWYPHVYVDQHGQTDNYFFPPNPMSVNANVDRTRLNFWTDVFGRATAAKFNRQGWTYFVRSDFDLYHPGYLDSFASLTGSVGMTHETDGGKYLNRIRDDGSLLTLAQGIEKHFVSAMAVIGASVANREALLRSFSEFKRKNLSGEWAGNFRRVVVSGDFRALTRLRDHLRRAGVASRFAAQPFAERVTHSYYQKGEPQRREFSPGTLLIDMAQPNGALAKALLDPSSDFEPEFFRAQREKRTTAPEGETYPGPERTEFYDSTAWALPLAYNLEAHWCETATRLTTTQNHPEMRAAPPQLRQDAVGYAIPYADEQDALVAGEAVQAGVRGMVSREEMRVGGQEFPAGTFLFLAARNEPNYDKVLARIAEERRARLVPLLTSYPDSGRAGPGSETTKAIARPKVAVVAGRGTDLAFGTGAVWFLFERVFRFPIELISANAIPDNLSEYSALIIPSGLPVASAAPLRDFASKGGVVVALGNYRWALGGSNIVDLRSVEGEIEDLPGALFLAQVDARNLLSYGYGPVQDGKTRLAIHVAGNDFRRPRKEGGSVVTIPAGEGPSPLLSGFTFTDTEKQIRDTVWVQDTPVGRGRVVLFLMDPAQRAAWPGLHRMLLNAVLLGPTAVGR